MKTKKSENTSESLEEIYQRTVKLPEKEIEKIVVITDHLVDPSVVKKAIIIISVITLVLVSMSIWGKPYLEGW